MLSVRVYVVPARAAGFQWAVRAKITFQDGTRGERRYSFPGDRAAVEAESRRFKLELLSGWVSAQEVTILSLMGARIADLELGAANGTKSPDSVEGFQSARKRLAGVLGELPAAELDRAALLRARDALLADGLGPETVNTYLRKAAACWRWCEERGRVDRPWPRVKALAKPARRKRPFTPAEAEAVLGFVAGWQGGTWLPLLALVADTGRRVSEVCRLQGRDLDREEGTVRVRQKGDRTLVLPVSPAVLELLPAVAPDAWLFPRPRDRRTGGGFGPARRDSVLGVVRRAVRELGIRDGERLDVHSFRRAFAADAHRAGVPDDVTRRLTGHESQQMLMHYQRETVGDDLRAAQERVRAYRASARVGARPPAVPQPAGEAQAGNGGTRDAVAGSEWGYLDSNRRPRPYQGSKSARKPKRRKLAKAESGDGGRWLSHDGTLERPAVWGTDPMVRRVVALFDQDPEAFERLIQDQALVEALRVALRATKNEAGAGVTAPAPNPNRLQT